MIFTERNAVLSMSNAPLVFYGGKDHLLVDPFALSFQIFDTTDDTKILTPVQVFPVSGRQTVNLTNHRIGLGRYAAVGWTVSGSEPLGLHEIRWFVTMADGDPELVHTERFEVLAGLPSIMPLPLYSSLQELRAAVTTSLSDPRLLSLLGRACRFIERVTRRRFQAEYRSLSFDGEGIPTTFFRESIIALESLIVDNVEMVLTDFAVYERDDPRVSYTLEPWPWALPSGTFRQGRRNVRTSGVFGYVDPGPPWGAVPQEIEHLARLLVARFIAQAAVTAGGGGTSSGPVIEERTRDQSVRYDSSHAASFAGGWTGDPEIDELLNRYMGLPFIGSP